MTDRFLILGYFGWQNAGDDAMLFVVLREIHSRLPNATFVVPARGSVEVPEEVRDSVQRIKLLSLTMIREIVRASAVVMAGGTHIYDRGGSARRRVTVLAAWLLVFTLAKVFRDRIYLIGLGVEPLTTAWGAFFARHIFKLANYIAVRDTSSFEIVKRLGFQQKSVLSFDLAALLPEIVPPHPQPGRCSTPRADIPISLRTLGVSILPFFEIYQGDASKDERMMQYIAEALNNWVEHDASRVIRIFTMKGASKSHDVIISQALYSNLTHKEQATLLPYDPDPRSMLAKIGQCDAFIGMRYHACVFACISTVPLIIVNYMHKCEALATDVKLSQSALITPDEILEGRLADKMELLDTNLASLTPKLSALEARTRAAKNFSGWLDDLANSDGD